MLVFHDLEVARLFAGDELGVHVKLSRERHVFLRVVELQGVGTLIIRIVDINLIGTH